MHLFLLIIDVIKSGQQPSCQRRRFGALHRFHVVRVRFPAFPTVVWYTLQQGVFEGHHIPVTIFQSVCYVCVLAFASLLASVQIDSCQKSEKFFCSQSETPHLASQFYPCKLTPLEMSSVKGCNCYFFICEITFEKMAIYEDKSDQLERVVVYNLSPRTQRNIFEMLLNPTEIRLYLPFPD